MSSQVLDYEEQPLLKNNHEIALVFPCCCGVPERKYFLGYTIFCIIIQTLSVISNIVNLFSKNKDKDWLGLVLSVVLLVLLIKVLMDFKKRNLVSTTISRIVSILMISLSVFIIVFIYVCMILILGFKIDLLKHFKEFENDEEVTRDCLLLGGFIIFPLVLYSLYLNVLYFLVIKQNKNQEQE